MSAFPETLSTMRSVYPHKTWSAIDGLEAVCRALCITLDVRVRCRSLVRPRRRMRRYTRPRRLDEALSAYELAGD